MATNAKLGYGTLLKRGQGDGPPETFTTVSEVLKLSGPAQKRDVKDATNMNSPASYKENIVGLIDPGQVQFDINWVPGDAQHAGLLADQAAGTLRNFQIALPAAIGKTWSFAAYVIEVNPSYPVDDKITATVTLQISGQATLA